ncbi:hypothetical protein A6A03_13385 [Chloroflexus islandicus]|uniref:Uncharacterized protein n=2 Tax=Chloroflexus islandicus TaxID=1707952 RepID=A0A178MBF8_9CHLR|nr:hypothetical protein A6A03_13385 [Chloroflexus islandicus]
MNGEENQMMQAIEFQATVKNGLIELPPQYAQLTGQVRVIVLVEPTVQTSENVIDQLLAQPVRIPNFRPLSRAEIYAR